MLVATFGPSTGWAGKTITYDDGRFTLQDLGPLPAEAVLEYDRQGHLIWADDGLREWVSSGARVPPGTPAARTSAMRVIWHIVLFLVLAVVFAFIGGLVFMAAGVPDYPATILGWLVGLSGAAVIVARSLARRA